MSHTVGIIINHRKEASTVFYLVPEIVHFFLDSILTFANCSYTFPGVLEEAASTTEI